MPTSRFRSRDQRIATVTHSKQTWNNRPTIEADLKTPGGTIGSLEECSDNLHSSYRRRIRNGEVIMSDASMERRSRSFSSAYISYGSGLSDNWEVVRTGDVSAFVESVVDRTHAWEGSRRAIRDRVLVNAYAKIRDDSLMSGEIMADCGQSLRMLRRPFGGSVKLLKRMLKEASRSYRKTTESVTRANAGAWLEYRYGWKPLFLDAKQGLKMYSQSVNRLEKARKVSRASEAYSANEPSSFACTIGFHNTECTGHIDQTVKGVISAGIIYAVSGRTTSQALSEDLRLGIDSMASTGWELIPLSFVVDWFVHVGPWLAAVNLPPSVSVLGSWVTTTWDLNFSYHCDTWKLYNPYKRQWEHGTWGGSSRNQRGFTRTANPLLPSYPPANFKLPGVIHATDGLALSCGAILRSLAKLAH